MQKIFEMLAAGVTGAVIVIVAMIYFGGDIERRANQAADYRSAPSAPSSYAAVDAPPSVNPEWPGAAFPSDAWKTSELEWYVQWKRVRKYGRIAFQMDQTAGFAPLLGQARDLWENVAGWRDGRPRAACLPAAEQLHKALAALNGGEASGIMALRASEAAGDKCRAAAQAAMRQR